MSESSTIGLCADMKQF